MKNTGKKQASLAIGLLAIFALAFSKLASATPPLLNIESPVANSVVSGVITVFGWAVGNPEVKEAWFSIDGGPFAPLPYGGLRKDVGQAFPGLPESDKSGFSLAYNTRQLGNGGHQLSVRSINEDDEVTESVVGFSVSNSPGSNNPFTTELDLSGARVTVSDASTLFVEGARVNGQRVNTLLEFTRDSNVFVMSSFQYDEDKDGVFDDDSNRDGYHDDDRNHDGIHDEQRAKGVVVSVQTQLVGGATTTILTLDLLEREFFDPGANRIEVDITGAFFEGGSAGDLAPGKIVKLRGEWVVDTFFADEVEFENPDDPGIGNNGGALEPEVSGRVSSVSGNRVTVAMTDFERFSPMGDSIVVDVSGAEFKFGTRADLVPGANIKAEGSISAGILLARQVKFL